MIGYKIEKCEYSKLYKRNYGDIHAQQNGEHDNLHLNALRHAIKNIRMLIIHLLFKQITIGNRYDLINNACSRSCQQSLKRYIHFIYFF